MTCTAATIGLILERRGALDRRRRIRRPPPRPGWYLPPLADGRAELDSFDLVEGLVIRGGTHVEVLNGISVHGGLVVSWPHTPGITASFVVESLLEHWRAVGLPDYAQFDNDPLFEGPQIHPDTIGRVARVRLSLGVVPVFVPPRETGFQAAIEGFNGLSPLLRSICEQPCQNRWSRSKLHRRACGHTKKTNPCRPAKDC